MPNSPPVPNRSRMIAVLTIAVLFLLALAGTAILIAHSYLQKAPPPVVLTNEQAASAKPQTDAPVAADGVPIGGVVHDDQGNPVANVKLNLTWRIQAIGPNGKPAPRRQTGQRISDAQGKWTFSGVPKDAMTTLGIQLSSKDYVTTTVQNPSVDAMLAGTAVFTVTRGVDIAGKVVDQNGKPIVGAALTTRVWEGDTISPKTTTDSDGNFALHHIPPTSPRVLVTALGFAPDYQSIDTAASAAPMVFKLSPGTPLKVRVVDGKNNPVSGVNISVDYWRNSQMLQWTGTTKADGRFVMPDAPSDAISFDLGKAGFGDVRKEITAGPTEQVVTLNQLPAFSGSVIDADTQKPIASFRAMPGAQWPGWSAPIFSFRNAKPFKDGKYKMDASGFGGDVIAWHVRVEADGYQPAASKPITDGGPIALDFALHRAADLTGRLVDAAGRPIAGAQMDLLIPATAINVSGGTAIRSDESTQNSTTDAQGNFTIHPQITPYEIWTISDNGCAETIRQPSDNTPIEMKMTPWARVRVHGLPPTAGVAAESLYLNLAPAADPTQRMNFSHWSYNVNAPQNGDSTVERLPAVYPEGWTILEFWTRDTKLQFARTVIAQSTPGQTTTVDLTGGVTVTGRAVPGADGIAPKGESRVTLQRLSDTLPEQWPTNWLDAAKASPPVPAYICVLNARGEFSLPAVAPGKYAYIATNYGEPTQCSTGVVNVPASAIGSTFAIPDIHFTPTSPIRAGGDAPRVLGRTLKDQPVQRSDFPGKFIIWMQWDSMSGAHDADRPDIDQLADRFAKNDRVALIAANTDVLFTTDAPLRRPQGTTNAAWTNLYLSPLEQSTTMSLGDINRNRPTLFLITPDGKIAAMDLSADQIGDKLDQLLAATK